MSGTQQDRRPPTDDAHGGVNASSQGHVTGLRAQSLNHPDRQGSEADSLAAAGGVCPFIHEVRDDA